MRGKSKVRDHAFRFVIASDGHFGEPGSDFNAYFENLVVWLQEEKVRNGLDCWFFNGPITHDNPGLSPVVHKRLQAVDTPLYAFRGNHDLIFENEWQDNFGTEEFFELDIEEILFLSCPTFDKMGNYQCPDYRWLKEKLQKGKRFRYIFLFLHICLGGWTKEGMHCPEIISLLEEFNITAVFHGHDHLEDGLIKKGELRYYFSGSIGSKWGLDYKGYRVVEIAKDHSVFTYQYDPVKKKMVNSDHINHHKI